MFKRILSFLVVASVLVAMVISSGVPDVGAYNSNSTKDLRSSAAYSEISFDPSTPPGVVLCRSATYTTTAAIYAASTLEMVPVPDNALILDILLYVTGAGPDSGNCTIDIGDGYDDDRYLATCNATGGTDWVWSLNATKDSSDPWFTTNASDTIDITFNSENAYEIGGTYYMQVFYKILGTKDENDNF